MCDCSEKRKIVFSQKESTTNSIDESILRSPGAKTQVKLNDLFQKRNENNFVSQEMANLEEKMKTEQLKIHLDIFYQKQFSVEKMR